MQAAQSKAQEAGQQIAAMASAQESTVAALQAQVQEAHTQVQEAQAQAKEAGQEMAAMAEGHKAQMTALQTAMATKAEALQASMMQVGGVRNTGVLLLPTPLPLVVIFLHAEYIWGGAWCACFEGC